MSNFRWGIIAAAAALIVCVALGIISDVRPLYIFLRALVFALIFFGIGFGAYMIINNFIPELLYLEEEPVIHENNQSGARVNITVGNNSEYAVPEEYGDSDPKELGNIEDLISGAFKPRAAPESHPDQFVKPAGREGIDGKRENDYNMGGEGQGAFGSDSFEPPSSRPSKSAPPEKSVFTASFGDDMAGLGGLPDLDAMATAFSSGGESRIAVAQAQAANSGLMEPIDAQLFEEAPPVSPKPVSRAGNKPQELEGDFNPKELAMGIRTVLTKDK